MRLARAKSVADGCHYQFRFDPRGRSYSLWVVHWPMSHAGPEQIREYPLPDGVSVREPNFFGASSVTFFPDGSADATGTVKLADHVAQKTVGVLAATGKVTIR